MLRDTRPVTQHELTTAAFQWARERGLEHEYERRYSQLISLLRILPLENARPILRQTYHESLGRPAWDPVLLTRLEVGRRVLRIDSRDAFVEHLHTDPFLRLLLGLRVDGPVPDAQTLRRFEHRVVPSTKRGVNMPRRRSRRHPGISERAVDFLMRSATPARLPSRVDDLLRAVGFLPAQELGLFAPDAPVIADGTFVYSRTNRHGHKICEHGRAACTCERRYTDPRANIGHDHHEDRTVYGYLANIAALDSVLGDPLPLSITMHGAARHDGVATLLTLRRVHDLYPEIRGRLDILASASDSDAHGRYIRSLGNLPIIPLRQPKKGSCHYAADTLFSEQGIPICAGGYPMRPYGRVGERQRWICPGEMAGSGIEPHEPCHQPGGHTRSFSPKDSYRLISGLHRGSRRFRKAYARRAAIERAVNKPMVSDSGLEHRSRVQSRGRHHFDLFIEALLCYARAFIRFATDRSA